MFGGVHELSIDSKGRLAIPAKFRDFLLRRYTSALVITLESRHQLLMYPESEWERISEELLSMKTAGRREIQLYQNLLLHNAELVELDASGRILLPAHLRKLVRFDKEVALVGRANRLELWDREHWVREMEAALDMDADELAEQLSQTDLRL